MSEISIGFIANVVVIGTVSYVIIFAVVDRICKCIESVNAGKIVFNSITNDDTGRSVNKLANMIKDMERSKNVR